MKKLTVNLDKESYNIFIGNNFINKFPYYIKEVFNSKKVCIVTDENLNKLYVNEISNGLEKLGFEVSVVSIPAGEKSKDFCIVPYIYEELIKFNITRSDFIVGVGGGVIGDLSGFVASTFLRGIGFVQIPTSLLAQVDSSIGGKVAVNLGKGKNLIGSFYHPRLVLIDVNMLTTLPIKYFNDGMAEVIKYGCIKDLKLFNSLIDLDCNDLNNVEKMVYHCCNIKKEIVEKDEKDLGERMILNFGHTLGHAIEKAYNFEKYSHGEAVAVGMYMITVISESKGLTNPNTAERIKDLLLRYNLPFEINLEKKTEFLNTIKLDKKNLNGRLNLILLRDIGESFIYKSNTEFFE